MLSQLQKGLSHASAGEEIFNIGNINVEISSISSGDTTPLVCSKQQTICILDMYGYFMPCHKKAVFIHSCWTSSHTNLSQYMYLSVHLFQRKENQSKIIIFIPLTEADDRSSCWSSEAASPPTAPVVGAAVVAAVVVVMLSDGLVLLPVYQLTQPLRYPLDVDWLATTD